MAGPASGQCDKRGQPLTRSWSHLLLCGRRWGRVYGANRATCVSGGRGAITGVRVDREESWIGARESMLISYRVVSMPVLNHIAM